MIFRCMRGASLEGAGTSQNPYKISSSKDFIYFLKASKEKAHYELSANIDLGGATLKYRRKAFGGCLDGKGHTVRNFTLKKRGLFGCVNGATVKNISFKCIKADFKQDGFGIVAAKAAGEKTVFENCYIKANAFGTAAKQNIGGYVGTANTSVDFINCAFDGSINAKAATTVGGFIGAVEPSKKADLTFERCANLASLCAIDTLGGFVANLEDGTAVFENCYNAGTIKAVSTSTYNVYVGHFLACAATNAFTQASFENCHVIYDVELFGGKAYSNTYTENKVTTVYNENSVLSNFCIFGYGGKNAKFCFEADHMGMDNPKYDAITKSEFFLKACDPASSVAFHGLGDAVTIGYEEIAERGDNSAQYSARLIGAVKSLDFTVGFEIKTGDGSEMHNVTETVASVELGGKTVNAPAGYNFITYDVTGTEDGEQTIDFTVYMTKCCGATAKDNVYGLLGARKLPKTYDIGDGYSMDIYKGVSRQYFNIYCENITSNYSLLQENAANGNLFKTYYDAESKSLLHTYWTPLTNDMRVIRADNIDERLLPVCDGESEAKCDVILHQLKAYTDVDGGLGFIFRLSDGRYIIVDGGHPTKEEADDIYNFMADNLVTDNITIAAWIFTHEHSDHMGGFKAFAECYADKVTLQHVLVNSCKTAEQLKYAPMNKWLGENIDKFPDAVIHKPLSGQKYRFASTTVEILYTMSDYLPSVIHNESDAAKNGTRRGNGNIQTIIFMLDLNSQEGPEDNILILGDAPSDGLNIVASRYQSYIRCKYLQVGHHGHVIKFDDITDPGKAKYCRRNNCVKEIYDHTDPEIAFWSAGEKFFYNNRTVHGINKAFFEHMEATGKNIRAFDAK